MIGSPTLRQLVLSLAMLGAAPVRAEPVPRASYGAKLEAPDRILHGGGQDASGFAKYWEVMGSGARPALLMYYLPLRSVRDGSLAGLASELMGYERQGVHLVVQLGLSMAQDGNPSSHYEGRVAAGAFDANIDALCEELEVLGHPVLLRIGYEFNGTPWNGYEADAYVAAFRRITDRIRARKLEVATVWDAAGELEHLEGFMEFYPGDEYVDWWGLNLFSGPRGSDASAFFFSKPIARFLDAAEEHRKPVLIGEATPRYTGVGAGAKSWERWFADFFELVARRPGIKAVSYINWDWARYSQWGDWGDARLERDPVVAARFRAVVSAAPYFSGTSEERLRAALGLPARAAAPERETTPDAPAAARTAPSTPVELLANGGFEQGAKGWEIEVYNGGSAKLEAERATPIAGSSSGELVIRRGGGTNWYTQLVQPVTVRAGRRYTLTAKLRGSQPGMPVTVYLQQSHDPYGGPSMNLVVGTEVIEIGREDLAWTAEGTDAMKVAFMVGGVKSGTVFVDEVSLIEESTRTGAR